MEETRDERKEVQKIYRTTYESEKIKIQEEIEENEGVDIQELLLSKRREWVAKTMEDNNGKIPDDIAKYYDQFLPKEDPNDADEEAKNADADEGKGKKGKDKKGKEGKKGKGKKGKGGGDDGDAGDTK